MDAINYYPARHVGMYVAKDHRGATIGYVNRQSIVNRGEEHLIVDINNLNDGLYERELDFAAEQ